jgi:hypothetical protein
VLHGGGGGLLPFIAGGGGWKRAAEVVVDGGGSGETGGGAEWQWSQSEHGRNGRRRYLESVADERGPRGFLFFLNYPNWLKLEN